MKATIPEVELTFGGDESDYMRAAYRESDRDKPFDKLPSTVTVSQLRNLKAVVNDALNNGDLDQSERVNLLRLRKQMKQVLEGIEKAEEVY